ncbi:double-stranded RNA-specific editase Adar isoform X2 [Macrosteles quadrilineatus]|uniref:double-stranded RNA-specific editase Adar isoform X2 n=1 Tax=Macrosteles quadrilineatus TaxID=74068 RepID=UPI0023E25496|nr:double-stranded RNA-specific editase Adar isoform X2 [Macrosteles quadrilineatus]
MATAVCESHHATVIGGDIKEDYSSSFHSSSEESSLPSCQSSDSGTLSSSLESMEAQEVPVEPSAKEEDSGHAHKRPAALTPNGENQCEIRALSPQTATFTLLSQLISKLESPARKKKKHSGISPLPRNAVCVLNEMRPGMEYKLVDQTGPVHCPIFTMSVKMDGQEITGQGRTKKQAKQSAAEAALRTIIQVPEMHVMTLLNPHLQSAQMDFTSDSMDFESDSKEEVKDAKPSGGGVTGGVKVMTRHLLGVEKSPVMILNEMRPGLKYECTSSSGEAYAKFTMSVCIDGRTFEGTGPSKKLAKTAAARAALSTLYDFNFNVPNLPLGNNTLPTPPLPFTTLQSHQADIIAKLVLTKYSELMEGDAVHARRKVLAGIVMTRGDVNAPTTTVISIGTGTKCVGGDHMSVNGASLNDSHAEIVARRGLLVYLYSQLTLHANPETASESIFEVNTGRKGFKLRDEVKFHLYINTAPCGDARIFSPHEVECSGTEALDKHPNRNSRGQLRTKIESGEGTIPVKSSGGIQTWDGVLQGQRLLTMSCSDKIARWNVVGVQGSLLSLYIEPVYLESIVLGSLFNSSHMYRAVCGRVETTVQGLPPPFRFNKPSLGVTSSPESRQPGKAPNHSVNWVIGEERVEIINAMTGKAELGAASRLCKQSMLRHFCNVYNKLPEATNLGCDVRTELYSVLKAKSEDYQLAKQQLMVGFSKANLGSWLKKPMEQDQFCLDDSVFRLPTLPILVQ